MKESTSMAIFERFNIKATAALAGLSGAALALSSIASATPWMTGGYDCMQPSAG
jgi:putative component of membrane protein insertase Oxa1/YidC/SpoIIIJ protein YidD